MPYAAHSFMLDPLIDPYAERVARVAMSAPQVPYISNITGTWVRPEQATDPLSWARHLRLPVRFAAGLKTIFEDPDAVLLEVGPGRSLGTLARLQEGAGSRTVVSSMRHAAEAVTDVESLLSAYGRIWLAGLPIDWQGLHRHAPGGRRRRVSLPTYPFERQRYWIDRPVAASAGVSGGLSQDLVQGSRGDHATSPVRIEWEPGMSAREMEEILARILASGEAEVVLSRRDLAAQAGGPRKVAAQSHARPELGTPYVAPSNPLEEQLAVLWQDLLGISGIGIHDNFYELGGHSLLATQVMSRVGEQFAVTVPLQNFFSEPTIADLALRVAEGQADRLNEDELAELLAEVQELSQEKLSSLLTELSTESLP
jgi:acyl transferase domain-containing protein